MESGRIRFSINEDVEKPWILHVCESVTMADLAAQIQASFDINEDKTASDLIVPVATWIEPYRMALNIDQMSRIFVADLDRLTPDQIETMCQALENASCIIYTTHSHMTPRKDGLACYRAIVELDREYALAEFPLVWAGCNRRLGGLVDPATVQHPELGYYLPSAPASCSQHADLVYSRGASWCVDDLIAEAREMGATERQPDPPKIQAERAGTAPNRQAMSQQITRWAKSAHVHVVNSAAIARALLDGKASIPVGEGKRNTSLYELASLIASAWRESNPQDIANLFNGIGWDLLSPDGKYTLEHFAGMITRCQDHIASRVAAERTETISQATQGERTDPVTESETQNLASIYGLDWDQHLVALMNRDCYLLKPNGTYHPHPFHKDNLFVAARDHLAVFGDHCKFFYEVQTKEGPKVIRKTLQQFLEDYGTVIERVVFDWTRSGEVWNPERGEIVLPAPDMHVDSVGHEEIHDWLELMDPILCDVLSQMPLHDRMCPTLVLLGQGNTGKTLLAHGVSDMYGTGPVSADIGLGEYRGNALRHCPIIFIDEAAPDVYRRKGTSEIRKFITCREWLLNEKFQSHIILRGFLRLIVAGNDEDILSTDEDMTAEARAAFGERLVYVKMDAGMEYIEKIGRKRIQENWLNGHMLAEHIRYLSEHWEVRNPGRRMAVGQPGNSQHALMACHSGVTKDVMYWIVQYLINPTPVEQRRLPIARAGGQLRIHPTALIQAWDQYLDGQRVPTPHSITKALKSVSMGRGRRQKIRNLHAYVIDMGLLKAAIEQHGADLDLAEVLQ